MVMSRITTSGSSCAAASSRSSPLPTVADDFKPVGQHRRYLPEQDWMVIRQQQAREFWQGVHKDGLNRARRHARRLLSELTGAAPGESVRVTDER
jgi:hypothetical protein